MSDNHVAAAGINQQLWSNLASKGPLFLPVAILGRQPDVGTGQNLGYTTECRKNRSHNDFNTCSSCHKRFEFIDHGSCFSNRLEQLPVSCNNRCAHNAPYFFVLISRALTPGKIFPSSNSRNAPPPVEI